MKVQIQHLRYFVSAAEHRHFTRAAADLGVAQPTLSKQIHTLEEDLGAPLFHRERGGVALTPAGEILLPIARRILADADTARREVQELVGLRRGRVRLGATPSLAASLVPPVLRRFRAAHPGVELHVEQSGSQDLVRHLTGGELDLALIILPEQGTDPALLAEPILRESLVVVSAGEEEIRGPLRIADLLDRPLVMFRKGYDLRDATLEACRREGFEPRFVVEGGEMDTVLGFVEAELGVAVVPGMVLAGRPRLRATPLAPPGIGRTVALAHRRESPLSHAAAALRATLLAHVAEAEPLSGVSRDPSVFRENR
ncbi:LysR family transcriptional regulator [Phytomonospora endophytica]|uniref:LysR family transcriptional regulator n=1 Tax=Phytomonospora endophytica TaxID=714109 RepID=UPI00160E47F0|nr:LysR substrate-binding domain-containing protein [Phytomonospora endophytica]GIG68224.1 LysR family transcriptional regulator [Phytomonospora endophytica]